MAKTVEDICDEWRKLRPTIGDLICHIDGKFEQLKSYEDAYIRGIKDAEKASEADKTIAYQRGLEDAWDVARKVFAEMDYDDVCDCFGVECANDNERFFDQFHPQEAIERLREYEQMKAEEIHLGDEVEAWDTNAWVKFIAIGDNGCEMIDGFDLNGGSYEYPKSACRKTGEHYQISHSKFEEKEGKTNGTTDNNY